MVDVLLTEEELTAELFQRLSDIPDIRAPGSPGCDTKPERWHGISRRASWLKPW